MLQKHRDPLPAERLDHATRLANEGWPDALTAYVERLHAEHEVDADDALLLRALLMAAYVNTERFADAARTLLDAEPLVAAASPIRQARYLTIGAWTAHGLREPELAIDRIVRALALAGDDARPSRELSLMLGNCGMVLARLQLFPFAVEVAIRAIAVAAASGATESKAKWQAAYSYLAWGVQLEHLGMVEQSRERWTAAALHLDDALADPELPPLHRLIGAARRATCLARLGRVTDGWRSLELVDDRHRLATNAIVRRAVDRARASLLFAEGRLDEARTALLAMWERPAPVDMPLWVEDVAWMLGRTADAAGDDADALRWHREMHERYGRAQYEAWLSRATAARLRVEQEALVRRARELESDALSDPLTGVPNRRAFDANLPKLVAAAQAAGTPLTLAIVDIDWFKHVNDTHGHPVGDEVLRRVARILREQSRDEDRCARYGGDELILCLPVHGAEAAGILGRLARAIAEHPWGTVAPGLAVTVSTGLAEMRAADTAATLFWAADQSLLAAKRARGPANGQAPAVPSARTASPRS